MIVAGEASGDRHAAKLVDALMAADEHTEYRFFGAAGPAMRASGVHAIVESDGLSIVGIAEIGRALPMFVRAANKLKQAAEERKPDVVILVDFPDFNLKLAKSLKKQGFRIVYYISPQLWAWRKYRISIVKKYIDLMITILPFEKEWYLDHGVDHVEYVGSPLAREVHAETTKEEFCRRHGIDSRLRLVSLLPGSRQKEIVRILPVMMDAAVELEAGSEPVQFVIPMATEKNAIDVEAILRERPSNPSRLTIVAGETYDAINASDAAAVTSGTATLETGILGTPMVIVYKTSAINYGLLEPIISVDHYGLINLIAEKRIAKELIQSGCTAANISAEITRLLEPEANALARKELALATDKLGRGGASKRAAEAILKLLA